MRLLQLPLILFRSLAWSYGALSLEDFFQHSQLVHSMCHVSYSTLCLLMSSQTYARDGLRHVMSFLGHMQPESAS